jgi:hypothetical protein
VAAGAPIQTGSVGAKQFTVNAASAGGTSSLSRAYQVTYAFSGFTAPVNGTAGALNVAKAGQTIPLKWRLLDATGAPITNLTSTSVALTAESLVCPTGSTTDDVVVSASGTSGLQNLGGGYYQYNWDTPTSYAGSCKTLKLNLGEGITRDARFQFTK